MITPMDDVFWAIGVTVAGLTALAVIGGSVFALALLMSCVPRLHYGAPKNPCEWRCYDRRQVVTTKSGGVGPPPPESRRIVQQFDLRWWIGISSQRRPTWFFGILRWERPKS